MKCYGQLIYESGSYAYPDADQYEQWDSVRDARLSLAGTWGDLDVDPQAGQGVTLLLWVGVPDPEDLFPCDNANCPPDIVYELGPRGGTRLAN